MHRDDVVGAVHEHAELFPAQPADQIAVAHVGADRLGNQLQDLVAAMVAKAIVDGLEVVGVDHEQRVAVRVCAAQRDIDLGGEGAAVEAIGQPVGCRKRLELAVGFGELGRPQLHVEHGRAAENDGQQH